MFGNNLSSIDQVLENIVYIELRRRGWKVDVGRVGTKEVDFIADKGPARRYFSGFLFGGRRRDGGEGIRFSLKNPG